MLGQIFYREFGLGFSFLGFELVICHSGQSTGLFVKLPEAACLLHFNSTFRPSNCLSLF